MKTCSDIRVSCPQPELAKHTRYEADELLRELLKPNPISAFVVGIGGLGKSSLMRAFAQKISATRQIYILAYQNSVAAKNGKDAMTIHQFCRKMAAGEIIFPATVFVDEAFYCCLFVLSRLVHFFQLPELQNFRQNYHLLFLRIAR